MSAVACPVVPSSTRNRSAVTNASWRLEGVDNRKGAGRRFRDLCDAFAGELGGVAGLTTSQKATVRQLAAVVVESEKLQAAIVSGGSVDHEQLVRLSNLQSRLIRQLGIQGAAAEPDEPDLASYLAGASG